MRPNIHTINSNEHRAFLAENRKDPYSQQPIKAGDQVVFCASCKSCHLLSSWNEFTSKGKNCICGATSNQTLVSMPTAQRMNFNYRKSTSSAIYAQRQNTTPPRPTFDFRRASNPTPSTQNNPPQQNQTPLDRIRDDISDRISDFADDISDRISKMSPSDNVIGCLGIIGGIILSIISIFIGIVIYFN